MKKGIVLLVVLTLLCGTLFPVYAEEYAETRSPRMSVEKTPPEEEEVQATETLGEAGSFNPAGSMTGKIGASSDQVDSVKPITVTDGKLAIIWEGYTAELISYGLNQYTYSGPDLYLYFHVVNNTDRILDLRFDDVTVDGVSVLGTGIYDSMPGSDTGDDPDRIWIMSRSSVPEGDEAILHAKEVRGTLTLEDSDTKEKILLQEVTIDLDALDGETKDYRTSYDDTYDDTYDDYDDTYYYIPAPSYRMLKQGDYGEDVKAMQIELISLGYLYDYADGMFGPKTAAAVKDFNEANGLDCGSIATISTQELLFSGLANSYTEPYVPLEIGANFSWDPVPGANTFFFKVQVTNHSRTRTVKGYELWVYYTDVWGKKLDGGVVYTQTMTQRVAPGETVYCASFNLGNWYSADTVWVGVSKIVFDDGEIRENTVVEYYSCELPSRIN